MNRDQHCKSDRHSELQIFVGEHYETYKARWHKSNNRAAKWSWNGWAALFHIAWFGYRKYYKPAFLFIFLLLCTDACLYYLGLNYAIPFININWTTFIVMLAGMLASGLFADYLYYRHAVSVIRKVAKKQLFEAQIAFTLMKRGGTNRLGIGVILAFTIIMYFLSHYLFPTNLDLIRSVRANSLYKYPLYTIGESFDQYLQQSAWEYKGVVDGLGLVEVEGYTKDKEHRKVSIQFLVDYRLKEIEPYTLRINGTIQEKEQFIQFLDTVFRVEIPFEINDELENGNGKNAM
jgi:hypothetical protein